MKTKETQAATMENKVVRLYTLKEVAALWGLSTWTIRGLIKEGRIKPIVGLGKGFYFDGMELGQVRLERL